MRMAKFTKQEACVGYSTSRHLATIQRTCSVPQATAGAELQNEKLRFARLFFYSSAPDSLPGIGRIRYLLICLRFIKSSTRPTDERHNFTQIWCGGAGCCLLRIFTNSHTQVSGGGPFPYFLIEHPSYPSTMVSCSLLAVAYCEI